VDHILVGFGVAFLVLDVASEFLEERVDKLAPELCILVSPDNSKAFRSLATKFMNNPG